MVEKNKIRVKEIENDNIPTHQYFRKAQSPNLRHETKHIRNEGLSTKIDNMLCGNRLVIFSIKEQIFATTVESPNIVETYKTLFNMAWPT